MKVVLFCGGQGLRMRTDGQNLPKPMLTVGYRPILWHVMRYYAHFGHKDFILCLGHRADAIKNYFRNYDETVSNDFVLTGGGRVDLIESDIHDWRITFVETGVGSNIGQRLKAVEEHLAGEDIFLANYSDGVTDLPLPEMIDAARRRNAAGSFLAVRPGSTFHVVTQGPDDMVTSIDPIQKTSVRINGGFFVFQHEIFDHIRPGEELVEAPFQRLIEKRKLMAYTYDGFWGCMDTFKERQALEELHVTGNAPWELWKRKLGK